jgi:membrane protease YdiL (CAAX protease family)
MDSDARAYRNTLLISCGLALAIAIPYSLAQHIPRSIMTPFLAAALVEIALYLAPGFAATRAAFERIDPPSARALLLTITAVIPYLIYAFGTHTFHLRRLGLLALLASVAAGWFVLQKARFIVDILFLFFMAAVYMTRVFGSIYIPLAPRAPAEILGHLMWIRMGVFCILSLRKMGGIGFGFLPTRKDWLIGLQQYTLFLPVGIIAAMLLHFARPSVIIGVWWKEALTAVVTFFGVLWVVALGEEFLFRGVLQQALARRLGSQIASLLFASALFGLVHLPFRQFPNWKFAGLAALAGLFYGMAYQRAGSIRASMVTHALVVTTWRVLFA